VKLRFGYTGIRVRDLDGAIEFFRNHLGMKLRSRVRAKGNKREFASMSSKGEKHWLELNWYADYSLVAHLGKERNWTILALRWMILRDCSRS
jgi:catechol 2,3-dioxygenase-like lactoylglutathione lyase family enzyme